MINFSVLVVTFCHIFTNRYGEIQKCTSVIVQEDATVYSLLYFCNLLVVMEQLELQFQLLHHSGR